MVPPPYVRHSSMEIPFPIHLQGGVLSELVCRKCGCVLAGSLLSRPHRTQPICNCTAFSGLLFARTCPQQGNAIAMISAKANVLHVQITDRTCSGSRALNLQFHHIRICIHHGSNIIRLRNQTCLRLALASAGDSMNVVESGFAAHSRIVVCWLKEVLLGKGCIFRSDCELTCQYSSCDRAPGSDVMCVCAG